LGVAVGALLLATCTSADSIVGSVGGKLAVGTWGGDNTGAIVTDTVAHIHIGCTFGDIPGRVALDADGRFTTNGSYMLRAYPVAVGPSVPAQFTGRVIGKTLTLSVTVNDTVQKTTMSLGPVSMVLGVEPKMGPCPICRVPGERSRMRPAAGASSLRRPSTPDTRSP
jgi:hypothetical protein